MDPKFLCPKFRLRCGIAACDRGLHLVSKALLLLGIRSGIHGSIVETTNLFSVKSLQLLVS